MGSPLAISQLYWRIYTNVIKPKQNQPETKDQQEVYPLTTKPIDSTSLSLQSVDDIEGSDRLSLGMFSVGYSIANDTLKEDFENSASLSLVNNPQT